MEHNLTSFAGRNAVFIESGDACVGKVDRVECDDERIRATFKVVPQTFQCHLRTVRNAGEDQIERVLSEPPFGVSWNISVSNKEFDLNDDCWQASFLWGGGFRIFFQPAYVNRFLGGDVKWIEEYYNEMEGGDDDA